MLVLQVKGKCGLRQLNGEDSITRPSRSLPDVHPMPELSVLTVSNYCWLPTGKKRLSRDTLRDATQQEVYQLRRENEELKQLVAELSLETLHLKSD